MITCSKKITFCSGHRIAGHENKCAHPHGHNYTAIIEVMSPSLDSVGRIIDFSCIKKIVGNWVEENWDHGFIACYLDVTLIEWLQQMGYKHFVLPRNPTAENMAYYLLHEVCNKLLPEDVKTLSVTLWETDTCYAKVISK